MTREEYMTKIVTRCCDNCSRIKTATLANLNKAGWMWYSSEHGEYSICPQCEKVRAEQAALQYAKEQEEKKRHPEKGASWGT